MATKCELVSRRQNKYKSFESLRNGISQLLQVNDAILAGSSCASMAASTTNNGYLPRKARQKIASAFVIDNLLKRHISGRFILCGCKCACCNGFQSTIGRQFSGRPKNKFSGMTHKQRILADRILAVPMAFVFNGIARLLGKLLRRDHSITPRKREGHRGR